MREDLSRGSGHDRARPEPHEIVVFSILRESTCAECGTELPSGELLRMEANRPLCLACADLDHLVFLPRGDPALTRRASRHSVLHTIVVRFSRSRKRYERQGVLVEEAALERAERECLADADARARARERSAVRRAAIDERYAGEFAEKLGEAFPGCPLAERTTIAAHACLPRSGRIGRSAAARAFDPTAMELAVRAHVRHRHTDYDDLLARGEERVDARDAVRSATEEIMQRWRQGKGATP